MAGLVSLIDAKMGAIHYEKHFPAQRAGNRGAWRVGDRADR